jgi:hypothetical protein
MILSHSFNKTHALTQLYCNFGKAQSRSFARLDVLTKELNKFYSTAGKCKDISISTKKTH